MNNNINFQIGKYGETVAQGYLTSKGYRILETNFHSRFGEIDIIARDPSGLLVFLEVKTRLNAREASPEYAINYRKLKKMWKTICAYLHQRAISPTNIRVDSLGLAVDTKQKRCRIRHIKGLPHDR